MIRIRAFGLVFAAAVVLAALCSIAVSAVEYDVEKDALPDSTIEVLIGMADIEKLAASKQTSKKPLTVFDLGTADGRVAIAAARAGAQKVVAIAHTKAHLALAKKNIDDAGADVKKRIKLVMKPAAKYADGAADDIEFDSAAIAIVNNFPEPLVRDIFTVLFNSMESGALVMSVHEGCSSFVPLETFAHKLADKSGKDHGIFKHIVSRSRSSPDGKAYVKHNVNKDNRVVFDLSGFGPAYARIAHHGELSVYQMLSTSLAPGRAYMGEISKEDLALAHERHRARERDTKKKTKLLVHDVNKKGSIAETTLADASSGGGGGKADSRDGGPSSASAAPPAFDVDHVFVSAIVSKDGNISAIKFQFSDAARRTGDTFTPPFEMRVRETKYYNRYLSGWASSLDPRTGLNYEIFKLGNDGSVEQSFGVPLPAVVEVEVRALSPAKASGGNKNQDDDADSDGDSAVVMDAEAEKKRMEKVKKDRAAAIERVKAKRKARKEAEEQKKKTDL